MSEHQSATGSARYLLAVAAGIERPPDCGLRPDVTAWFAGPREDLVAAIERIEGRDATVEALRRLAPSHLRVRGTVASVGTYWAEIERRTGDGDETTIIGVRENAATDAVRIIWLRAPVVPGVRDPEVDAIPNRRSHFESYFAALRDSRFREAAEHFGPNVIYSHPPYRLGTKRVIFRGREELAQGFVRERGDSPARQVITGFWQHANRVFLEGYVDGIPSGGTFVATAELTAAAEIARYVAFYMSTRIP